jgi:transcription initiation factor IIE alpha subunit
MSQCTTHLETRVPFGACERCESYYVLDAEGPPRRRCPRCGELMRSATLAQAMAYLRQLKARRDTRTAEPSPGHGAIDDS